MKKLAFVGVILILAGFIFIQLGWKKKSELNSDLSSHLEVESRSAILKSKAELAKIYCENNKLNTHYVFLLDYGKHSGKHRFYVWDFDKQLAVDSGLVSHGCGQNSWGSTYTAQKPIFSNQSDSHASSLGKYRIGKRGYSQWGIHVNYLLHGLDKTNSAAVKREIVLHSWEVVSDRAVFPDGTPEGWGCPAVSNGFMKRIDVILKDADKSVLMWVFN